MDQSHLLDKGVFVVSIDTELAWSAVHHDSLAPELVTRERATAERDIVHRILDLFERHQISATWAVVGHLFLSGCTPAEGKPHPEITRPEYRWLDRDWFARDPGTDLERDPMWYGTDLIEMIAAARPQQEIGSHSFSHLIAGEPGCSEEAFVDDLRACRQAAEPHGVALRSFVYPRNTIGHIPALSEFGFTSYRGVRPRPFAGLGRTARLAATTVDKVSPRAGSVVLPEKVGEIWNLPATSLFAPLDRPGYMPLAAWVWQQEKRMHQAIRHQSLYHLWFHPHNLLDDPETALGALDSILSEASRHIDRGGLENLTMAQLSERLESANRSNRGLRADDAVGS